MCGDDDVERLFPGLLAGSVDVGPFRPVRGRWAWVLVHVLQLAGTAKASTSASRPKASGGGDGDDKLGDVWFVEPDVGWSDGSSLPQLLSYAEQHPHLEGEAARGGGDGDREGGATAADDDNDEDDDRPAVDFLGPGLCNSLDTSAKFWRSKGHWETQEFTDAVEGIARHGRWHCQLQLTMMSRRLRDALVRDIRNGRVAYVLYLRARMHAKHVFARAPLFG